MLLKFTGNIEFEEEAISYVKYETIECWERNINIKHKEIDIVHLNIRSLRKNFAEFMLMVNNCLGKLDVIILSEVNIKREELSFYTIDGYNLHAETRENQRGGGVLIYTKESLNFEAKPIECSASEAIYGKMLINGKLLHLFAIYRPPRSNKLRFIKEMKILIKSVPSTESIILIGDTNLNTLGNKSNGTIIKYKNTMCEHGLMCAIPSTEITREAVVDGELQQSCIDHVWVRSSRTCTDAHAYLLACRLSDHHLVGARLELAPGESDPNVSNNKSARESYAICNSIVREKLSLINWSELIQLNCPLKIYEHIYSIFNKVYEESTVKIKMCSGSKRTPQPWASNKLCKMIEHRDNLFRLWKSDCSNMNLRLEYTKYRNKVNKIVNLAKNKHKQSEIIKCEGDVKKMWFCINKWLGRKKCNLDQTIQKYLGKTENMENVCNNFSKTFTQEIQQIKHNCNIKFLDRNTYVKNSDVSFRFNKVSPKKIEKIIDGLSCNKAPGIDKLRVQDIKYVKTELSVVLAKFINLSVTQGIYPNLLKKALIRPIFKQGSHYDYTNYRPIAILSVINKIVEKAIVEQVSNFLEKHKHISEAQHGFRKGRSTATALTKFTDYVNEALDGGQQVLVVFIDFKKAFDTLEHEQLLQAMDECGIRGPTNQWFRSYLTNRTLKTSISGVCGEEADVNHGVPTGSVYGPVGYTIHVNSVPNVVQYCKVVMYADDTCLLISGKDINAMVQQVQADFLNLTKWAHDNGIILNVNKTKCMHIYSPYNKRAKQVSRDNLSIIGLRYDCLHSQYVNCKCTKLELVEEFKYLGLILDKNFNWKPHVNSVCSKLRKILGQYYYLKRILNMKTMYAVYHALVDSIISYGLNCYGRTFKTYLDNIKNLQIRILKYLVTHRVKKSCKGDYCKLFKMCNVLSVDSKVQYLIALETYYSDQFKTTIVPKFNTRSSHRKKLCTTTVNNYYGERTRKYMVPKIYNSHPVLLESPKLSKPQLKEKLYKIFI